MAATKLLTIPRGYRTKDIAINGTAETVLVPKTSRGSRYKLPAKVRQKMAAARKKIKIPVLTVGANIIPAAQTAMWVVDKQYGLPSSRSNDFKVKTLFNNLVTPYTGLYMNPFVDKVELRLGELAKGLLPNLIVFGINKVGVFRATNQKLANAHIPVRLS